MAVLISYLPALADDFFADSVWRTASVYVREVW